MLIPAGVGLRGYDAKAVSVATSVDTGSESFVQQHLKDEVDINTIVRRFGITREMPAGIPGGVFGDFTGIDDFESAVAAIDRAREGFMSLPAEVRERFGNEPGKLIEFVHTATEEQVNGLIPQAAPPPPAAPQRVIVVPDPEAKPV